MESDLLQFLGESLILSFLVLLFLIDFLVSFDQSFFSDLSLRLLEFLLLSELLFPSGVVLCFSDISGILDFLSCVDEVFCLLIFLTKVILTFGLSLLLDLTLVELDTLP